jgi:hypothetical protein
MANECRIIDNKVGDDHRSKAENPMVHALSCQWPFGKSKLDLKQSSLRRVRSNNLKLASWRAALVVAFRHRKQEMPVARALVSQAGKFSEFTTPTPRASETCKAPWVLAVAVAKHLLRPRASCSSPRPARRRCRNRRRTTQQIFSWEKYISGFIGTVAS